MRKTVVDYADIPARKRLVRSSPRKLRGKTNSLLKNATFQPAARIRDAPKLFERVAILADPANFAPRAATVGSIALPAFLGGRRDDLWGLLPKYHRLSAAEEKLAARTQRP